MRIKTADKKRPQRPQAKNSLFSRYKEKAAIKQTHCAFTAEFNAVNKHFLHKCRGAE